MLTIICLRKLANFGSTALSVLKKSFADSIFMHRAIGLEELL